MPRLPHLSAREIVGALQRLGFAAVLKQAGVTADEFLGALK